MNNILNEEDKMKVFISWSGEKSNQIAEIIKKWIKQVIQSVDPFVSSQDLPKGTRWSSDIAKELQNTNFGILCVTKDNYQEPWLLFEAGALSKTIDKTYVVPLLFDVEPSDLQDSPLLQFQASSFDKKDMKKLIQTLNNSNSADILDENTLDEAFEVWFPKLEICIKEVSEKTYNETETEDDSSVKSEQIMEEILDLTRTNQKLLMNPDENISQTLTNINEKIDSFYRNKERLENNRNKHYRHLFFSLDEMTHDNYFEIDAIDLLSVLISVFKSDFPWLFENGKELVSTLKSKRSLNLKNDAIEKYLKLIDFTSKYLIRRVITDYGRENYMILRDLYMYIDKNRESFIKQL